MIHSRPGCNFTISHPKTGKCKECSLFEHHEFIKSFKFNLPTENPLWQSVSDGLKNGRKWRIQKKPSAECGHPGVKNTQGKCIFCITEDRKEWKKVQNTVSPDMFDVVLRDVNEQLEKLTAYMHTVEAYKALGASELPVAPSLFTRRQKAVQEGKKWYFPETACQKCGVIAEKYVANGKCRNCGKAP